MRWYFESTGLVSRRRFHAESIVKFHVGVPFQMYVSSWCIFGWKRMEFHIGWRSRCPDGKLHLPALIMSATFAFQGRPVEDNTLKGIRSQTLLPSGSQ
jgi:hypothetical protein